MQTIRGRYNGTTIEPLERVDATPGSQVLVIVLEGELERAAARVERIAGADAARPDAQPQGERPDSVGEVMTTTVVTVNPRMTTLAAMHLMSREGVTSVLVEPGAAGGWGIMTIRDVLERIVHTNRSPEQVAVGEMASRPLVTVERDTSLQACSELMLANKIRRAVIMHSDQPVGIISESDIFRVIEQYGWQPQA